MKLPGYNYRTGNPVYDNESRRLNRKIKETMRGVRITTPRGRHRKKYLTQVEGGNYIRLINEVAVDLWARDHPRSTARTVR